MHWGLDWVVVWLVVVALGVFVAWPWVGFALWLLATKRIMFGVGLGNRGHYRLSCEGAGADGLKNEGGSRLFLLGFRRMFCFYLYPVLGLRVHLLPDLPLFCRQILLLQ